MGKMILKAIILVSTMFLLLLVDRILIETTFLNVFPPYLILLMTIFCLGVFVLYLWRENLIKIEGPVVFVIYSIIAGELAFMPVFFIYCRFAVK